LTYDWALELFIVYTTVYMVCCL